MNKVKKILIFGCGKMTNAIFGHKNLKTIDSNTEFYFYSKTKESAEKIVTINNAKTIDKDQIFKLQPDIVFFCFKPQNLNEVAQDFNSIFKDTLIISILAGVSIENLIKIFSSNNIIRIMPNVGSYYKKGLYLKTFLNDQINKVDLDLIEKIIKISGDIIHCKSQKEFDQITMFSGCLPGNLYFILNQMDEILQSYGVDKNTSRLILSKSFQSTNAFLENMKFNNFQELIDTVASKKGVTEAINNKLEEQNLKEILINSYKHGEKRTIELNKLSER